MFPFLYEKKKKEELKQIPLYIELHDPSLYEESKKEDDNKEDKIVIIQF